jgi:transcription elongation factor GreA
MEQKEYLTKEKHEELVNELKNLTNVKRSEIAEELQQTGAMGDLRENAEYQQARESQAELESRIQKIESILQNAEIVAESKDKGIVGIGSMVTICKKNEKDCTKYKIVGAEEANMAEGKISIDSPLVKAMIGKKKGDSFVFQAPKGAMEYSILKLE